MHEFGRTRSGRHCQGLLFLLAATLILSVGAIGTVRTDASASTPKLSTLLLSVGQMPTGWKLSPTGNDQIGCFGDAMVVEGTTQTASASAAFQSSGGAQSLYEKLVTYTNAKTGYGKVVASLLACKQFKGTTDGQRVTGTIEHLSFPQYGDTSEAFAVKFAIHGVTAYEDLLIVRRASIVAWIDEGNFVSVNLSQFRGFVTKAVAKLPS